MPHRMPVRRHAEDLVARLEDAHRDDSSLGVNLRWRGDTLALEYLKAKRQAVVRPSLTAPLGPATVVLAPGVVDSTAPAASMLRFLFGEVAYPGLRRHQDSMRALGDTNGSRAK